MDEQINTEPKEFDNDSDPEICQAQMELRDLRKQRKLAAIRSKIEEEKRLLAQETAESVQGRFYLINTT
jgi:hypothetical protein